MRHPTPVLSLAAALLLASPLLAADSVSVESRITDVTVYADRALVTRTADITVGAGESAVLIEGLPEGLVEESLRVEGLGNAPFLIGSIESRQVFAEELVREEERKLNEEIQDLQDQIRALDDRIRATNDQLAFIKGLVEELPKNLGKAAGKDRSTPAEWKQAWSTIGDGSAAALETVHKSEMARRDLQAKVEKKQRELAGIRTGAKTTRTVRVNLESKSAAKGQLKVHYQMYGAMWRPLYEARLDVEKAKTALVQRAEVRQGTGEDWNSVALTLSTARPSHSVQAPDLYSWFIDIYEPPVHPQPASAPARHSMADSVQYKAKGEIGGFSGAMTEEALASAPAEEREAVAVTTEFSAEFAVGGRSTVPADSEFHKFTLGSRTLDSALAVRSVPKLDPTAYLFSEITWDGDAPLLPGTVAVFRDGAYIGNGHIGMTRTDEKIKLSYGPDDRVKIAYFPEKDGKSREGLINKKKRIERRYRTEVENYHDREIEITIQDQVPVPQDERIEVELLDDITPPTAKDVEDRKGVMEWKRVWTPKEKGKIRLGYSVTYPVDENVPGF